MTETGEGVWILVYRRPTDDPLKPIWYIESIHRTYEDAAISMRSTTLEGPHFQEFGGKYLNCAMHT